MTSPALRLAVDSLLDQHSGGTKFFNALDEYLRNSMFFEMLYRRAMRDYMPDGLLVTGQFGEKFRDWLADRDSMMPVFVQPGDLRHHPERAWPHPSLADKHWVFLDDSLYAGRTLRACKRSVLMSGGDVVSAHVLYYGARRTRPDVQAFYYYWLNDRSW